MKVAESEFDFQGGLQLAFEIGQRLENRSRKDLLVEKSPEAARAAVPLLGRRLKIAKTIGYEIAEAKVFADFATLIRSTTFPDHDESLRYASRIFFQTGQRFAAISDFENSVISFANSSLCYLELFDPTLDELKSAHDTLIKTFKWRRKGTEDAAFHQFLLSMAINQLVNAREIAPTPTILKKIFRGFNRAHHLFKVHNSQIDEKVYHLNIIEALTTWLRWEKSNVEKEMADSIPELIPFLDRPPGLSRIQVLSVLRANPAVLGFNETPAWVPSHAKILEKALERIPKFDEYLNSATDYIKLNPDATDEIELGISSLRHILAPLHGQPQFPLDELKTLWLTKDYEGFIVRVFQEIATPPDDYSVTYVETLINIKKAIEFLRLSWAEPRLHRFLQRNPVSLRFTACELARMNHWKEAFQLLELTRGLVASGTASKMVSKTSHSSSNPERVWIHLTHSPKGTYLICSEKDHYFGATFPEITGSLLSTLFSGFHPPGLLSLMSNVSRVERRASVDEIRMALLPVSEWILKQKTKTIVLHPGGFFQAFPIWSVGKIPEEIESERFALFQVPSQTLSINHSQFERESYHSISVQEAATVPGQVSLPLAEKECEWILERAPSDWITSSEAATPESILNAAKDCSTVHYSGHSLSNINPLKSALHTYGGTLTVERILNCSLKAKLVLLGSCESGLPQNFQMQDEFLSIQSAFWYSGVSYVAGTHWSVTDRAASAFAKSFYKHLFKLMSSDDTSPDKAIYLSWVKAVSCLRQQFDDPLEWSAFSLIGNPVSIDASTDEEVLEG